MERKRTTILETTAGASALRRFVRARSRLRRRVARRAQLLAAGPLAAALLIELMLGATRLDWALGFFVGAVVAT
jgi:hypothetical protein